MPKFSKIRKLSETGIMTESELRRRLARGELPGFYVGARRKEFVVDVDALISMLKAETKAINEARAGKV